jgi:16S rRNA (cytosine1402-N4)-methyltransferase
LRTDEENRPGHVPVLLTEAVDALALRPDAVVLDATVGLGGHSREILKRIPQGRLIALDQDADALQRSAQVFQGDPRVTLRKANFAGLLEVLKENAAVPVDAVLMDLGVSSLQLGTPERGFSFQHSGPLDMRMDPTGDLSALDVVNRYGEGDLKRILFEFGEEPKAALLARRLIEARNRKPLETTDELAALAEGLYPSKGPNASRRHPATRLFQALRIEVNHELSVLQSGLEGATSALRSGGRLAVITFHSLEDRAVKGFLAGVARTCVCPPKTIMCHCGHQATFRLVTKKPMLPSEQELRDNPRSRSAKLRVAEKLERK